MHNLIKLNINKSIKFFRYISSNEYDVRNAITNKRIYYLMPSIYISLWNINILYSYGCKIQCNKSLIINICSRTYF